MSLAVVPLARYFVLPMSDGPELRLLLPRVCVTMYKRCAQPAVTEGSKNCQGLKFCRIGLWTAESLIVIKALQ